MSRASRCTRCCRRPGRCEGEGHGPCGSTVRGGFDLLNDHPVNLPSVQRRVTPLPQSHRALAARARLQPRQCRAPVHGPLPAGLPRVHDPQRQQREPPWPRESGQQLARRPPPGQLGASCSFHTTTATDAALSTRAVPSAQAAMASSLWLPARSPRAQQQPRGAPPACAPHMRGQHPASPGRPLRQRSPGSRGRPRDAAGRC